MIRLTREQIEDLVQPGDHILVHYMRPNPIQSAIRDLSDGPWMHALKCLGGLLLTEADVVGVVRSSLKNYLQGDCRLLLRRPRPRFTAPEESKSCRAALAMVGDDYDFGMILGMVNLYLVRDILRPVAPRAATWAMKHLKNLYADPSRTTCAEHVVRADRAARHDIMSGWPAENISPNQLARSDDYKTVADWHAPLLIGDRRRP